MTMTNPYQMSLLDQGHEPLNWHLFTNDSSSRNHQSISQAARDHRLEETFKDRMLTAFADNPCYERTRHPLTGECELEDQALVGNRLSLQQQFDYKYLPDIDGNSFSGRYRGFLLSNSVPIKATLFREWLDLRLVPWLHFVPMSNAFHDFYAIMEYFFGYGSIPSHDEEAKLIAEAGRRWGEKVLRREDQEVYMFRLLLEYARVLADDRDELGFVADLL